MRIADLKSERDRIAARQAMAEYLRYAKAKRAAERMSKPPIDPRHVAADLLAPEPLPPATIPKPPKPIPTGAERVKWSERITAYLSTVSEPVTTAEITAALGVPVTKLVRVAMPYKP